MIRLQELQVYCVPLGFNLGQAERDYMQHLLLFFLSKNTGTDLVFKGGTALQKAYGLNRFSIDLDFTQSGKQEMAPIIEKVAKGVTSFGYACSVEEVKTLCRTFIVSVHGPLFRDTKQSICTLRIEISQRESVLLKPISKEMVPMYADLQPYTILVMRPEEIFAEKVRAIITRNKPRDVFDLHFLLQKGIRFDKAFIDTKMGYYRETFDTKQFVAKVKEKRPIWEKEMRNYVSSVPAFDVILKEITKGVRG